MGWRHIAWVQGLKIPGLIPRYEELLASCPAEVTQLTFLLPRVGNSPCRGR